MEEFKILPIRNFDYVEKKEELDEFKELLASLKEEVYKLENDEAKSEITECLESESLQKVNDRKLKDSLFLTIGIIDKIKNLIEKYEVQNDSDEETKESSLGIIEKIEEHCEKYIGQI